MSLAIDLDRMTPLGRQVGADDEQVSVEVIQERIKQSGYLSLRKVGCEIAGGWFVLWGSVPSYYLKQMAQELAGGAVGLEKIKNRIQVRVK